MFLSVYIWISLHICLSVCFWFCISSFMGILHHHRLCINVNLYVYSILWYLFFLNFRFWFNFFFVLFNFLNLWEVKGAFVITVKNKLLDIWILLSGIELGNCVFDLWDMLLLLAIWTLIIFVVLILLLFWVGIFLHIYSLDLVNKEHKVNAWYVVLLFKIFTVLSNYSFVDIYCNILYISSLFWVSNFWVVQHADRGPPFQDWNRVYMHLMIFSHTSLWASWLKFSIVLFLGQIAIIIRTFLHSNPNI